MNQPDESSKPKRIERFLQSLKTRTQGRLGIQLPDAEYRIIGEGPEFLAAPTAMYDIDAWIAKHNGPEETEDGDA